MIAIAVVMLFLWIYLKPIYFDNDCSNISMTNMNSLMCDPC